MCFACVRFLGRGPGTLSEAVSVTDKVHPLEGLEPGAEHVVRPLTKNWVGNSSIFEDVIEERGRGEAWDRAGPP